MALEKITDLVQMGLHMKRVEVSPCPLDDVLWKAQIPARLAVECAQAARSQARGEQQPPVAWGVWLASVLHSATL